MVNAYEIREDWVLQITACSTAATIRIENTTEPMTYVIVYLQDL